MERIIEFIKKPIVRRIIILAALAYLIYLTRSMLTLFILTFIFIYLVNEAQKFVYSKVSKFLHIKRTLIIVFIYVVSIAAIVLFLWHYIPIIAKQTGEVFNTLTASVNDILNKPATGYGWLDALIAKVKGFDWNSYIQKASNTVMGYLGNAGHIIFDVFLSIILSMFYLLQKSHCKNFIRGFKESKVSWLYNELAYFGAKFSNTFGKVLETQILISFINCLLSIALLALLGFPNVLGLGVLVFILGLIPVAGVFISLLPLSIIAFSIGGIQYILYVIIVIAVLHGLESYVLNPKLMSSKTNLPVFFTLLIITISGHFFGVWGLLVGIPVFVFILDILDVKIADLKKPIPSPKQLKTKLKGDIDEVRDEVKPKKEKVNEKK